MRFEGDELSVFTNAASDRTARFWGLAAGGRQTDIGKELLKRICRM
jgi:hypothetical protein